MKRLPDIQVRELITFADASGRITEAQANGVTLDPTNAESVWILLHVPEEISIRQSLAPLEDGDEAVMLEGLECYEPSALFAEDWPKGLDAVEISAGGWQLSATLRGSRHAVTTFYLRNWGDYSAGNDSAADDLARIIPVSSVKEWE